MNKLATILLLIVTTLAVLISLNGFLTTLTMPSQIFQIMFVPITVYLFSTLASHLALRSPVFESQNIWIKLLIMYCLVVSCIFVVGGFMSSKNQTDFITSFVFLPLPVYFLILVFFQRKMVTVTPVGQRSYTPPVATTKLDENRRDFLKLIGTAGISIFVYNLLFRRDVGPLLGNFSSNNNTNPLTLKNAQGDVINPAEKSPTEGYSISQIDDSPTAYFGFINNMGQWFIMRQDTDNSYRYSRGDKDFTSNWTDRTKLEYDYFDNVF